LSKCDVSSCHKEASDVITELAVQLCDWHAYEYNHNIGWVGKTEEDNIKNIIPKIKDTEVDLK